MLNKVCVLFNKYRLFGRIFDSNESTAIEDTFTEEFLEKLEDIYEKETNFKKSIKYDDMEDEKTDCEHQGYLI